ncbi:DNA-binding response regulator [Cohnella soli]|uniref:DNA-binding response regulator n=1 Tax=Cohnella soli TaxID=425005 RepID=A0ABW0HQL3_9BACL
MDFNTAYTQWLSKHRSLRQGERLRRLDEGHGYLEKLILENVWWPAVGHFDDLHPEYEVFDFRDGTRFLDFAWLPGTVKLDIEGDGFDTHARKISLTGFDDDRIRQNHLVIDEWKVLRFTHNMVNERPRLCQQMLQQFIGAVYGKRGLSERATNRLNSEERDIIRLTLRIRQTVSPADVCKLLDVEAQKARKLLRGLVAKGVFVAAGAGQQRIHAYRLSQTVQLEDWGM